MPRVEAERECPRCGATMVRVWDGLQCPRCGKKIRTEGKGKMSK